MNEPLRLAGTVRITWTWLGGLLFGFFAWVGFLIGFGLTLNACVGAHNSAQRTIADELRKQLERPAVSEEPKAEPVPVVEPLFKGR